MNNAMFKKGQLTKLSKLLEDIRRVQYLVKKQVQSLPKYNEVAKSCCSIIFSL
jgi:hypothetical protein